MLKIRRSHDRLNWFCGQSTVAICVSRPQWVKLNLSGIDNSVSIQNTDVVPLPFS